jgi:hypothetical protein
MVATGISVTVEELDEDFFGVLDKAELETVTICSENVPVAYMIPADVWFEYVRRLASCGVEVTSVEVSLIDEESPPHTT